MFNFIDGLVYFLVAMCFFVWLDISLAKTKPTWPALFRRLAAFAVAWVWWAYVFTKLVLFVKALSDKFSKAPPSTK